VIVLGPIGRQSIVPGEGWARLRRRCRYRVAAVGAGFDLAVVIARPWQ